MEYPLFNSIVHCIEQELEDRSIDVTSFRTWDETKINASGLEIVINLRNTSEYIDSLRINFDWDRFREYSLAKQLEGMDEHPLLQKESMKSVSSIAPVLDIEVVWVFDPDKTQQKAPRKVGNERIESASKWMDSLNRKVNELLLADDIITRWHLEVEGDQHGKYLSAIHLLSYFQFTLSDHQDLDSIHSFVNRKIQHLLYKTNKVIKIADETIETQAA
jgi:hypothetical protein